MDVMMLHTDVAPRIEPLSAGLINKIAAGEVIERPANVVKELLENAVDALASRIDVDIEAGGSELIRVTDDGEGIHPDDLVLAVSSHATSKLRDADDLFRVHTMGFRGEALASIAEVSRLRIRSRQPESLEGCELSVDAGERSAPRPCGCPVGTSVEVRELFLNTPVRRKFLKTQSTEFGHISEQFTRIALANPQLHLVLRHNEKLIHELPAAQGLRERLELFYGSTLTGQLIEVEAEHNFGDGSGDCRLWGFVAHPSQSKSSRKGQYLFLNGRCIQDRSLQHALGEAYRGLLMVGRYPQAFLFLEVPADQVDVNVHPTKAEVRFRDAQQLYRLLLSTLRNRFLGMDLDSPLSVGSPQARRPDPVDPQRQQQVQRELVAWAKDELANWQPRDVDQGESPALQEDDRRSFPLTSDAGGDDGAAAEEPSTAAGPAVPEQAIPVARPAGSNIVHVETRDAADRPASGSAELRAMQIHDCYLVVETDDGVTVIDQHALHERILYERLRNRVLAGGVEVQRLLVPLTVELSAREAALLAEHEQLLRELGLPVEQFGGTTVAVSGLPTMLHRAAPEALLRGVVELLEEQGTNTSRRDMLDSLLHMMACKAAIKAGQRLKAEEITALLSQRDLVDDAHHCPHGRPTALTLSREALDRQFGRLG
jgi:DNA mismatch repair protein MutL